MSLAPRLPTTGDLLTTAADALDAPFPSGGRDRLGRLARLEVDFAVVHRDEGQALRHLGQAVPEPYRDWWGRFIREEVEAYRAFVWNAPLEIDLTPVLAGWGRSRLGAWERAFIELTRLTMFGGVSGRSDVASELRWILEVCGCSLTELELALEPTLRAEKEPGSLKRKWQSWLDGVLPTRGSIEELAYAGLRTPSGEKIPSDLLTMRLLAARAFQFLHRVVTEREVGPPTQEGTLQAALRALGLSNPGAPDKSGETAEQVRVELATLERTGSEEGRLCFVAPLVRGRLLIQTGRAEEAVPHYVAAAERGAYRAGRLLGPTLHEGLAAAAHVGDRVAFRRLYGLAFHFGQYDASYDELVEASRLEPVLARWSGKLAAVFRHPFTPPAPNQACIALEGALVDAEPWYRLGRDGERKEVKVIHRTKDTFFSGFGQRPLTPLMIAGGRGDDAEVARLLRLGGNPNLLASDGSTALIRTLQTVVQEEGYARSRATRASMRLLDEDLSPSIDACTHERRATALQLAVQAGHPDLVQSVIRHGASVDGPAGVERATPLTWALNYAVLSRVPSHTYLSLLRGEGAGRSPLLEAILAVPGAPPPFTSEAHTHRALAAFSPDFERLASEEHGRLVAHRERYLELARLLLGQGADPNLAPPGAPPPVTLAIRVYVLAQLSHSPTDGALALASALTAAGGRPDKSGYQLADSPEAEGITAVLIFPEHGP